MNVARPHSIASLRERAARRLPAPIFDYLEGGAEDEVGLRRAVSAFDDCEFLPRALVDVSSLRTETELFGRRIPWPLMLSPTGLTRLFHPEAERAVAQAASAAGLPYCLSTLGTSTIEEFGAWTGAPKLFQFYIFKDRGLTVELADRAREAGYDGLVLTVDNVMSGKRERDLVNGLSVPPRLTPQGFLGFALKPRWSLPALFGRKFDFANIAHRIDAAAGAALSPQAFINAQFDRSLTWKDVEWLAGRWDGALAVKGILTADDARRVGEAGADTVIVSNHGGRQLGTAVPPIEQIAPIADAVSGRLKIICDGGVRRGADIVKALALGADACAIGRPYLYGLAAGGEAGVRQAIEILHDEFTRTMVLTGVADIAALGPDLLRHRRAPGRSDAADLKL